MRTRRSRGRWPSWRTGPGGARAAAAHQQPETAAGRTPASRRRIASSRHHSPRRPATRVRGESMAVSTAATAGAEKESFAALLDESLGQVDSFEGTVVKGRVVSIDNDVAVIDVGLKSEGRVAVKEF